MGFGRLDKPAAHQPMSDINVTPLVDVMLVLLVIFIIAAPLMSSRLELELPQSTEPVRSDAIEDDVHVMVALDAQGQVYWGDELVGDAELEQRLRLAAQQDRATELRLQADERVSHGRVIQVMAMAQRAGLPRLGFVTQPAQAGVSVQGR
jgi:biopolymer transport protein TolR